MEPNTLKYDISPSVVPADKETEITIKSYDNNFQFFDDLTYKIIFYPFEESDVPLNYEMTLDGYEKNRKVYEVKPKNGVLSFSYLFIGEQQWKIHVFCDEYPAERQNPMYKEYPGNWQGLIDMPKCGTYFYVYSLKPDLYERRALKCDLHVHSDISDGSESPAFTAARYRKAGYDVLALTDHHAYNSGKYAAEKFDFATDYELLCGEEIHNGYLGQFHMVNINSEKSVNEVYLNEPERVEAEVEELKKEVKVPEGVSEREYLHRVWLYREAKKSGGLVIYPHPNWFVYNHYHTETKMSRAIMENGLCDAFEIFGGCSPEENRIQAALYNTLTAEGAKLPIVGSTDCHSVFSPIFDTIATIAFVNGNDITEAISNSYTAAVLSLPGEHPHVTGDYRFVKYTYFLLNRYFPVHNELCDASGSVILDYILGNTELKPTVEALEARITAYEKKFFGR